ncbi:MULTISPECIES: LysR family transcriptional regulator [Alphaproteobacteria]|uniref:LysR substrate-binding domain-containing protein n=1 Tax=Alphaproteobacteria TaxID=28211 RepID=UPI000D153CF4|nr:MULTISPECIES: LysR family transcriptional regulator [unclassified Sphingobium]MBG6118624.1 DNA-binding transcriptional LysR family regulator [Sphingobium sp. JAI105]MQP66078.1 LysR family transcriptional regulator [Niveispirillum sp. SYP-B3756]PSO13690.1 LysR family transcriptional regulator [Sphingobium sp. AEW4]TWD10693.1 LysR family transcriptional regulator [Sphingobium sp. AEW010]TWD27902.1 LysR family transcriptional regulator [Sphingobium sp. AEW013]
MPDLSLDLRYLRYAHLAAEHGSFRRAALSIGVNQSTLTRRVQLLERRLGVALFERRRTGVVLTPIGSHFLQEARVGAEHLHRAVKELASSHTGQHGHLRIGLMGTLTQGPLPELLRTYRRKYPKVKIRVEEASFDDTLAGVSRGRLDVAFVIGEPQIEGFDALPVWKEPLVVVTSVEHPLARLATVGWSDLTEETILVSSDAFGLKVAEILGWHLRRLGSRPQLSLQQVGRDNLIYLVREGFGLTLAVKSMISPNTPDLSILPVQSADHLQWTAVWTAQCANPALRQLTERLRLRGEHQPAV